MDQFIDLWALALVVVFSSISLFVWLRWRKKDLEPALRYSDISVFLRTKSLRQRLSSLPTTLLFVALLFFLLAFVDIRIFLEEEPQPSSEESLEGKIQVPEEGHAIYLILDQSGSMKKEMIIEIEDKIKMRVPRMEHLKKISKEFIQGDPSSGLAGRSNDLLGLIAFARVAHISSPLTFDHAYLIEQLETLKTVGREEDDGTAIGYAIFKTANLIAATKHFSRELLEKEKPSYEITNTIAILITDGLQHGNPLDREHRYRAMSVLDAAHYAREMGVRFYIVNIEPKIREERYAMECGELQYAAEVTGGKFYVADSTFSLREVYQEIDTLEKSILPKKQVMQSSLPKQMRRFSLYPYFIVFGMLALFFSVGLETVVLRRVP